MMTAGSSGGYCRSIVYAYKHNKIYIYIICIPRPSHVWPTGRPVGPPAAAATGNRQTNGRPRGPDATSGVVGIVRGVCECVCARQFWGWGWVSRWTTGRGFLISGNQISRRPRYIGIRWGTYLIVVFCRIIYTLRHIIIWLYALVRTHVHVHARRAYKQESYILSPNLIKKNIPTVLPLFS